MFIQWLDSKSFKRYGIVHLPFFIYTLMPELRSFVLGPLTLGRYDMPDLEDSTTMRCLYRGMSELACQIRIVFEETQLYSLEQCVFRSSHFATRPIWPTERFLICCANK